MSLSVFYYDASVFLFPLLLQFQSIFVSFVAISSASEKASEKSGNLKTDLCVNHANEFALPHMSATNVPGRLMSFSG